MPFSYLDHTADVRVRAIGSSLEACLKDLALGMVNYMTPLENLEKIEKREFNLDPPLEPCLQNLENFIFRFLDEVLWLYGSEYFMVADLKFINFNLENFSAKVECFGEIFTIGKHESGTEVKAVTKHDPYIRLSANEEEDNSLNSDSTFEIIWLLDI